ncbi:MAG TPA: hypothetical protein VFV38_32840 [Ktedonobacteraceae bacterium]|nr:hypothetical protein [Ktedonobacteraceae bacterium]
MEHMRRAFDNGEGEERVLAIFALGLASAEGIADLLAPLLDRAPRMERWASVICLGFLHNARAFPFLERLLLDGLDLEEYTRVHREENEALQLDQNWYAVYRWYAIQFLEGWSSPSLIPTLKQTYAAFWRIQQHLAEQGLLPHWWLEVSSYDATAYALGQRGDFTLLDEVDVPPEYRNIARISMALAHLHAHASRGTEPAGLPSRISALDHEMLVNETLTQFVGALQYLHSHVPLDCDVPRLVKEWRWFVAWSVGCVGILRDWLVETVAAGLSEGSTTLTLEALQAHALSPGQWVLLEMKARSGEDKVESGYESSHQQLQQHLSIREKHPTSSRIGDRAPTRDPVGEGERGARTEMSRIRMSPRFGGRSLCAIGDCFY